MFRSLSLPLAGVLAFLASYPAHAVDLFGFRDSSGHVLTFAVPGTQPVSATVDQTAATQAALDWAWRFYHLGDLNVLDVTFETTPTRFWRVSFSAGRQTVLPYAVVLPDGRPVEPTIRDET